MKKSSHAYTLLCGLTVLWIATASVQAMDVTSTWLGGTGEWDIDTNWDSVSYPNNDALTYYAVIDSTGAGEYTVTLDTDVTIDSLQLNSADATLHHTSGVLSTPYIDLEAGTYLLEGGTIQGATISSSGSGTFGIATWLSHLNILDGVTLQTDLDYGSRLLGSSDELRLVNGLTLSNATIVLGHGSRYGARVFSDGTQTIGGHGEIVFDGENDYSQLRQRSGTLTLGSAITVRTAGSGGRVGIHDYDLINQGTIRSAMPGQTLCLWGNAITNEGLLEATNGGVLEVEGIAGNLGNVSATDGGRVDLSGNYIIDTPTAVTSGGELLLRGTWSNPGGISVNNAKLSIGDVLPDHAFGSISLSNSTLGIVGNCSLSQVQLLAGPTVTVSVDSGGCIDNTGSEIVLSASGTSWQLAGGTIVGGTITQTDGPALRVLQRGGTYANRFESVYLDADIAADANTNVVLDGSVNTRQIMSSGGVTLKGSAVNEGTIVVDGGYPFLGYQGPWSNPGVIIITDSSVNLGQTPAVLGSISMEDCEIHLGGFDTVATWTTSDLKQLSIGSSNLHIDDWYGALDNTGDELMIGRDCAGLFVGHGSIIGGTISSADGTPLTIERAGGGKLEGVTMAADTCISAGASIRVHQGLTLADSRVTFQSGQFSGPGSLVSVGDQTLGGTGEVVFQAEATISLKWGSLTVGPGVNIFTDGAAGVIATGNNTLFNEGTIAVKGYESYLTITGERFNNTGCVQVLHDRIMNTVLNTPFENEGRVEIASRGTLDIEGSFSQTAGASLMIELLQDYCGKVEISQTARLGGKLILSLSRNAKLHVGDTFHILTAGVVEQTFDEIDVSLLPPGVSFDVQYGPTEVVLEVLTAPEILDGDINYDGFVGQDDMDVVLEHWGASVDSGDWMSGDISGDGFVGQADLDSVLDDWGKGTLPQ